MSLEDTAEKTIAASQPRNSGVLTVAILTTDGDGNESFETQTRRQTQVLSAIENALSDGQLAIVGPSDSVEGLVHTLDLVEALDEFPPQAQELTGSKAAKDRVKELEAELEAQTQQISTDRQSREADMQHLASQLKEANDALVAAGLEPIVAEASEDDQEAD